MSAAFSLATLAHAGGIPFAAVVRGAQALPIDALAALGGPAPGQSVLQLLEDWSANWPRLQRAMAAGQAPAQSWLALESLHIHPPVNLPRQVFCSGANYRKHVIDIIMDTGGGAMTETMTEAERRAYAERMMDDRAATGEPYMFSKPVSVVCGARDDITLPQRATQPDWELELAVVIGKPARHVSRADALTHVAGYTIANDITNRDLVWRRDAVKAMGTDWVAAKCAPGYLPLGPVLLPAAFVTDPQALQLTLCLNGQTMQDESTADMIFDIARQIEYLSSLVQLWPGDVLCTGSPAGNGTHYNRYLRPGDLMQATITGMGEQRNRCIAA